MRFGLVFFLSNQILFFPSKLGCPLGVRGQARYFAACITHQKVLDLKFCNLAHPEVLHYHLQSPTVPFCLSPKSSKESRKLRPSDGTVWIVLKGIVKICCLLPDMHPSSFW